MDQETIMIIRKKLQDDVSSARDVLLRNIEMSSCDGITPGVEERIKAYRKAYRVLEDFEEWADEQEEQL